MTEGIVQKIEHIRSQPEHIRLRYALGSVAVCMIFVLGIWMLTLKQGVMGISSDAGSGKDQIEESLSGMKEALPSTDSLKTLKDASRSLDLNNNANDAEEFLNKEISRSTTTPSNTNPTDTPTQ